MAVSQKTYDQLVAEQATAIQASRAGLIDFSPGSILRAAVEAFALEGTWLQAMVLAVAAITRLATSKGSDADSFVADFGVTRLAATAAAGIVTFSRFSATGTASIPVGSTLQSGDGTQRFIVTADATNPAFSANAYLMAAGVSSLNVPAMALVAAAAGDVAPGVVTVITSPIPGVDTVTNALSFGGGTDAETDAALRLRFPIFIRSLSKATEAAIQEAAATVPGLTSVFPVENVTYTGVAQPGYFYVIVDDGSGSPSAAFLDQVATAIEAVRGFTISFGVFGPQIDSVAIGMTVQIEAGFDVPTVTAAVSSSLTAYIDGLALGTPLRLTRLAQVAYNASSGVTDVSNVLINGAAADVIPDFQHLVHAGAVTVTPA